LLNLEIPNGTGHGKIKNKSRLKPYHVCLAVNAGVTFLSSFSFFEGMNI